MSPEQGVVRNRNAILIHYHLVNAGDSIQRYRDIPEFYYFNIIDPDGHRVRPVANSEMLGAGIVDSVSLAPGQSGAEHVVNLACMEYHPLTFTPRFRRTEPEGCMLEYRLRKAGRYMVIGQRIPPGPMPEYNYVGAPPSQADTIEIEYRPWWKLWH
jgi:hypothetical protein